MRIISKLSDLIEEEQSDAEKYIRLALVAKEDYPELAATFYKLSTEEMIHASLLHGQVLVLISEYRKANGNPPERMQAVYDYLHEKHISRSNDIKIMQALYKGQ